MVVLRKDDMIKKIAIIIFLMLAAHCAGRPQGAAPTILPGLAFAAVSDDTLCLQCPAEEYLTIETWYPSPWNAYDELRSNRIVVGGGMRKKILCLLPGGLLPLSLYHRRLPIAVTERFLKALCILTITLPNLSIARTVPLGRI